MNETRRNLLVGLFMIVGLGVLATLLVLFGERPSWLGGAEWELKIIFTEAETVAEGMQINLSGVQVGRVGQVEFVDSQRPHLGLEVVGLIKDKYTIPRDSKAHLFAGPLGLGRGRIDIVSPPVETPPLPKKGASIPGEMANPFEGLIPETLLFSVEKSVQQIGTLAERATPLADDLHNLFETRTIEEVDQDLVARARGITANVYTLVQRLDETFKHLNELAGDPEVQSAFRDGIQDLRQAAADAREMIATLRDTSAQVQEDLDRLADRLDSGLADANEGINEIREVLIPALDELSKAAENLSRASRPLADGEGTLGMLIHDARLYEAMLLSMERVTDAVDTLRRILKRFEEQGRIDLKLHEAVGPFPVNRSIDIPPAEK